LDAKLTGDYTRFPLAKTLILSWCGFCRCITASRHAAVYEKALVNKVQRFGNVAQVFTSYASRSSPEAKPFQRGINRCSWYMTANAGG